MRLAVVLLLAWAGIRAQDQAPVGIVRGELLEWDAGQRAGELSIRSAGHQVFRFLFDEHTYFEREKQRISSSRLEKGDALEIVADQQPGARLRYARTVHVIEAPARPRPVSSGRLRLYRSPIEHLLPTGNLTFAGVIARLNDERLVLRTRVDGEKTIYLRRDTRYLDGGDQVDLSSLHPNIRVFIRAARNLDNELEAYQVIWGAILTPEPSR